MFLLAPSINFGLCRCYLEGCLKTILLSLRMYSFPQQSLVQTQPFAMNAIARSGLPSVPSPALGSPSMGLSALRNPQMRPAYNPSQMGFSRQLSSITGISLPLSVQPGMGIVGRK